MFQDCKFTHCKTLGLQFPMANQFNIGFSFIECVLDHCNFSGLKLNKTKFTSCRMHEVDFEGTELKKAIFNNCDLARTNFYQSNLEEADFTTAYNFQIDPDANRITGAKFSLQSLPALLTKYKLRIS
ncbi:pentapeptide repeat-containing protein [Sphingobacterium bovistauri]